MAKTRAAARQLVSHRHITVDGNVVNIPSYSVKQGQVIGKSGTNSIDKELGNHLHFELYSNSQVVNPEDYFDKEIKIETTTDKNTTTDSTMNNQETSQAE